MWLAVVSQPFDAGADVPCLVELNKEEGEFWVPSPWAFAESGQNLSAYERNGVFLNLGNLDFFDISFISGADSDGDGRSVVAWDITGDGMPELFVRQAGGGPLRIYRNGFPRSNWIRLSLQGTKSNRFGIGAKISCRIGNRWIRREVYPIVNFLSQRPSDVHLGLGQAKQIDELIVQWPSGKKSHFERPAINQHLNIVEGELKPRKFKVGLSR